MNVHPSQSSSEYALDRDDIIVRVSPGFVAFAQENDAPDLTEESVLGTCIWSYIAGMSTSHLYAIALNRVRDTGRTICFPFRCDSPDRRRFMELSISPGDRVGALNLSAILLRTEIRPAEMTLLDRRAQRDSGVTLESCSFCRRIRTDLDTWLEVEDAVSRLNLFATAHAPMLSHGVCPTCLPEFHLRMGQ